MSDLALPSGLRIAVCRAIALALTVVAIASPSSARAETTGAHAVPVVVLPLDSDDVEEHADALTGALRSHVRASEGWSLVETSQSLAMMMVALRCTKPIDAACEQRLAEQIKADHFIFGWLTKGPTEGSVSAEVHLYQKGKPTKVKREVYAANLRDQNDDALRTIAGRILAEFGETALGSILVRAGDHDGEVIVDGSTRVPLTKGTATLALSPGGHSVEVLVPGHPSQKRNVLIAAGEETLVELAELEPAAPAARSSFPVRPVIGGALVAAGLGVGVVSLVNWSSYNDALEDGHRYHTSPNPQHKKLPAGKTTADVCGRPEWSDQEICKANRKAVRHSTVAVATAVGGGLLVLGGAFLLVTSFGGEGDATKAKAASKPKVAPVFGPGQGGLVVTGAF